MEEFRKILVVIVAIIIFSSIAISNYQEKNVIHSIHAQCRNTNLHGLGCIPEKINFTNPPPLPVAAPSSWDWRSHGIMTSVKNQGSCGACVAFACCGAFEAVIKWKSGETVDLSEAHLFFCSGGTCADGEYVSTALNYLRDHGTPDENCFPYDGASSGTDLSCSNTCDDWQERAYKIKDWGYVGSSSIKDTLVNSGPLVVTFAVYTDFDDYWNDPSSWPNGVYYHQYGDLRGYHAVVLVGYDDSGGYWICKNSWGSGGGLSGYFKIKYGECDIDDGAYYITYNPTFRADAGGPYKGEPGQEIQFHGNAYAGAEPYTWHWEFGDGATSNEQNPKHAYSKAGTYTVTLTVTDNYGKQASDKAKAIINTPPDPPQIIAPAFGKVNMPTKVCFKANDVDGDRVKYYVDWGDRKKQVTSFYASNEIVCLSHVWLKEGKYVIKAQTEDVRGATSSISRFNITIGKGEPPYKPYDPYPANNATSVDLSPRLSWKGGDPNGDEVYYTIYFGSEGNMSKIADNITETNYTLYGLQPFTRYYWRVIAYDETGLYTIGDIWNFMTKDVEPPQVKILQPTSNRLYTGNFSIPFYKTFIIGKINVVVNATDNQSGISHVDFYVDGKLMYNCSEPPYTWLWNEDTLYDKHVLEVIACDNDGNMAKDGVEATVLNIFP